MKITLPIILMLVLFQSNAQNLVPNPSFELGPAITTTEWMWGDTTCNKTNPLGGPNFWTVTAYSPDRVVEGSVQICGQDIDTAAFGSAYVLFAGSPGYYEAGKTTLISPIIPDSVYYLSCYYKREAWSFPSFFSPSRACLCFNSGDTIYTPLIADLSSWHKFDTLFSPSAVATELELLCMTDSNCGIKIDNISLSRYSTTTTNIFETPTSYNKKLIKIYDAFGRETEDKPNTLLIFIYSDGTRKKNLKVE